MRTTTTALMIARLTLVVGGAGGLGISGLAGCAGSSGGVGPASAVPGGAGDQSVVDALAATYAEDMNALSAARPEEGGRGVPVSSRSGIFVERNAAGGTEGQGLERTPGAANGATAGAEDPEVGAAVASGGDSTAIEPGADVQALARELASALRRRAIDGPSPYEDLSRVAMLEGIAPGVLEGLGEDAAGDSAELVAVLAPSEREALRAARRTARTLAEADSADPARAADALRAAAESLDESQVIRIRTAELCTRVDGFARYQAFGSHTFLAGRTTPMIVYTEVDRFRQKPVTTAPGAGPGAGGSGSAAAGAGSGFVVSLTQSLNLYFSEGGLLVWRRPPQTVTDHSTGRFRDFYIIDTIELPATLSAGAYTLKVVVRDEATGQQTESMIPINLVADPTLVQGG